MSEPAKPCGACGTAPIAEDGGCAKCGWNGARGERRCLRCKSLVEAAPDHERLKLPGGAAMGGALLAGVLGGLLGGLTAGFAAAAVGSVIMAQTLRQRCSECRAVVPDRALIEGERTELHDKRATLFMRAGLMAAGSAIAGFVWLQAVMATADVSQVPPSSAATGVASDAPDVAALAAAGDAEGLAAVVEKHPLQREAAVEALGRLGDNAVPALLGLLSRADQHGKRAALNVLKRLAPRTERAVSALTAFVQAETQVSLRAQAISVLAEAGPNARGAVPVLEPLLGDYALGGTVESALRKLAPETDWGAKREALRAR